MKTSDKINIYKICLEDIGTKPAVNVLDSILLICGQKPEEFHPDLQAEASSRVACRLESALEDLEFEHDIDLEDSHHYGDCIRIEIEGAEYVLMTEYEREQAFNEACDQYVDEFLLPELPASCGQYFDYEAFRRDCSFDGYGHTLNHYDSNELEVKLSDDSYVYLYRVN